MEGLKIADLANDNKSFHDLRKSFDEKINTVSPFMEREEFINQELQRIKSMYLKPLEVRFGGDFRKTTGFNFTHYVQYGYDWLSSGVNYSIEQIVDGAAKGTDHPIHDRDQFASGIKKNLETGVGLVLYEQFLKKQLSAEMENNLQEMPRNIPDFVSTHTGSSFQNEYQQRLTVHRANVERLLTRTDEIRPEAIRLNQQFKEGFDDETKTDFFDTLYRILHLRYNCQGGDWKQVEHFFFQFDYLIGNYLDSFTSLLKSVLESQEIDDKQRMLYLEQLRNQGSRDEIRLMFYYTKATNDLKEIHGYLISYHFFDKIKSFLILEKDWDPALARVMKGNFKVDPEPMKLPITTPDRVMRELSIIDAIFKAQYLKYDKTDPFPYVLDKTGHSGIDGRYLVSVFLLSDVELFSLQGYKKEFTIRFESTTNLSLLKNQLLEIRDKAIQVRDYYNSHLTKTNKIVDDFIDKNKSLDTPEHFQERLDFLESHRSVVTISNYHLMEIYMGIDLHSKNGFWDRDKYTYNYLSDNSQLASICQRIIDFVDQFELAHQAPAITHNKIKNMPKYFKTEIKETFDKKYLKIYLQHGLDHAAVSSHLNKLHSVHKANVTVQQSGKVDLTVYPAKAYDISETQEEVELTLNNYFKGNNVDPQFIEEPVSSVSEKAYFQVIDYMLMLGKNLEGSKRLNEKLEEEWYRDYFIPYLNTISKKHTATGETFHSKGKTDILFLNEAGEPVLIAECKLWKGEKALLEAVDQLLNTYVNWRDEKIALIVFNRDVKKFSDVIETATKAIEGHKLCLKALGQRKDTSYSYLFRNPDDEKRTIKLELVLFNVT